MLLIVRVGVWEPEVTLPSPGRPVEPSAMLVPSCCHWYEIGPVPVAVAENVAVVPTPFVTFCGSEVKNGGVGVVMTARYATELVTERPLEGTVTTTS